eukprot:TRINITY_DN1689_c0_g1_i1.p1 TRINITY_DN1689_c0_g1~~TRINITY_DN1689_c0_g1_i1.p1  ORF type:complete len:208 (+),score=44.59 TRINITY_DN1689_c0_g1_i1:115-738(+)
MHLLRKNKTLRKTSAGPQDLDISSFAGYTLGTSSALQSEVLCPEGEDLNEWVAFNLIEFYDQVQLLFNCVRDFCTPDVCASMTAGKYEYLWSEGKHQKPVKCTAAEYVDLLLNWVQVFFEDETVFPGIDGDFPKNFMSIAKNIFRRLFRVYGHMYKSHSDEILELGITAHLNASFKHFVFFVREFNLISRKELAPLEDIIEALVPDA